MPSEWLTLVHHVEIDFARPLAVTWDYLIEMIVGGGMYSDLGYEIEPLAKSPFYSAGYRMRSGSDGGNEDATCLITELDAANMRVSLHAAFRGGRSIFASYRVTPCEGASRLSLSAHSHLEHSWDEDASAEQKRKGLRILHEWMSKMATERYTELKHALEARG